LRVPGWVGLESQGTTRWLGRLAAVDVNDAKGPVGRRQGIGKLHHAAHQRRLAHALDAGQQQHVHGLGPNQIAVWLGSTVRCSKLRSKRAM